MVEAAPGTKFPKLSFWSRDAKKLQIINPGDLRLESHLQVLGLADHPLRESFAVSDRAEIEKRQQLIRMFLQDEHARKMPLDKLLGSCEIPMDASSFLAYFKQHRPEDHNAFWKNVADFVATMCAIGSDRKLPDAVNDFVAFLVETSQKAEEAEKKFAARVANELKKTFDVQGMVSLVREAGGSGRFKLDWAQAYGYNCHIGETLAFNEETPPEWTSHWAARATGLSALKKRSVARSNRLRMAALQRPYILRTIPHPVIEDILGHVNMTIKTAGIELPDDESTYVRFFFSFTAKGLRLRMLHAHSEPNNRGGKKLRGWNFQDIECKHLGFTAAESKAMMDLSRQMEELVGETIAIQRLDQLVANLANAFDNQELEMSGVLKAEYLRFTVSHICESAPFSADYAEVTRYRDFVRSHVRILEDIRKIALALAKRAEDWHTALSFPEFIADDKHVVSFKELAPVHLIGRETVGGKILEPWNIARIRSFADLNGKMIGLTGPNGKGKTVTEEALLYAIYDAHCGFPIFGQGLVLNTKVALGAVFLERGDKGSACELMFEKMRRILIALKTLPPNQTVLIIDELGSATQEVSGYAIGKRFLATLVKHGCSTVFSTQITALAQEAQKAFGALCYQITPEHKVVPGIGMGMAEQLAKEVGLDALLEPAASK